MVETMEDVARVREIAAQLKELGVPQKLVDNIFKWVRGEAKLLRNAAQPWR